MKVLFVGIYSAIEVHELWLFCFCGVVISTSSGYGYSKQLSGDPDVWESSASRHNGGAIKEFTWILQFHRIVIGRGDSRESPQCICFFQYPKSDCIYHFPIDLDSNGTRVECSNFTNGETMSLGIMGESQGSPLE